jgi:hypothetical protein
MAFSSYARYRAFRKEGVVMAQMNPLEDFLSRLTPQQRLALKFDWRSHARANQLPP